MNRELEQQRDDSRPAYCPACVDEDDVVARDAVERWCDFHLNCRRRRGVKESV